MWQITNVLWNVTICILFIMLILMIFTYAFLIWLKLYIIANREKAVFKNHEMVNGKKIGYKTAMSALLKKYYDKI